MRVHDTPTRAHPQRHTSGTQRHKYSDDRCTSFPLLPAEIQAAEAGGAFTVVLPVRVMTDTRSIEVFAPGRRRNANGYDFCVVLNDY